MADEIIIFSAIGIVIAAAGLILNNLWTVKQRNDRRKETREERDEEIVRTAVEKTKSEQRLAKELSKENETMLIRFKTELKDYVDKGDLDVKRELAYAVKLIEKDIAFLQQFLFGKEAKSKPAYLSGKVDTREHKEKEGSGMFKDTEQESEDREKKEY